MQVLSKNLLWVIRRKNSCRIFLKTVWKLVTWEKEMKVRGLY